MNQSVFFTYAINQLKHINKYVQSHIIIIIIIHQLVSVTLVTIIGVFFL